MLLSSIKKSLVGQQFLPRGLFLKLGPNQLLKVLFGRHCAQIDFEEFGVGLIFKSGYPLAFLSLQVAPSNRNRWPLNATARPQEPKPRSERIATPRKAMLQLPNALALVK